MGLETQLPHHPLKYNLDSVKKNEERGGERERVSEGGGGGGGGPSRNEGRCKQDKER